MCITREQQEKAVIERVKRNNRGGGSRKKTAGHNCCMEVNIGKTKLTKQCPSKALKSETREIAGVTLKMCRAHLDLWDSTIDHALFGWPDENQRRKAIAA